MLHGDAGPAKRSLAALTARVESFAETRATDGQLTPSGPADMRRLIERLAPGAERKLILVSAPPGFGKTTLLAEWLAASPGSTRRAASSTSCGTR